jgi:hypothetical protein
MTFNHHALYNACLLRVWQRAAQRVNPTSKMKRANSGHNTTGPWILFCWDISPLSQFLRRYFGNKLIIGYCQTHYVPSRTWEAVIGWQCFIWWVYVAFHLTVVMKYRWSILVRKNGVVVMIGFQQQALLFTYLYTNFSIERSLRPSSLYRHLNQALCIYYRA